MPPNVSHWCRQFVSNRNAVRFGGHFYLVIKKLFPPHRVLSFSRGNRMAEPTYEELKARLAELEKQQGPRRTGSLEFRVGEKGGVSVYGLGRFPVTLYYEQWIRLLDAGEKLREFLEENKSKLKLKG